MRILRSIPLSSSLSESPIDLDTQVSEATLNLIRPLFAVILNLYRTPHIPNQSLLHRYTVLHFLLSSTDFLVLNFEHELFNQRRNWILFIYVNQFLLSQQFSILSLVLVSLRILPLQLSIDHSMVYCISFFQSIDNLSVPVGNLPWTNNPDATAHEMASCELVLSLVITTVLLP